MACAGSPRHLLAAGSSLADSTSRSGSSGTARPRAPSTRARPTSVDGVPGPRRGARAGTVRGERLHALAAH
eukprot:2537323-Rhodomonas_salina.1